jgi:hypothetical protein
LISQSLFMPDSHAKIETPKRYPNPVDPVKTTSLHTSASRIREARLPEHHPSNIFLLPFAITYALPPFPAD